MIIDGVAGFVLGYIGGRFEQWRDSCINCIYRRAKSVTSFCEESCCKAPAPEPGYYE